MTAALCTVTNTIQGPATPPGGGGSGSPALVVGVLYQVTAELRPLTTNFNDGQNLIIDPYTGTIVNTPILISGFLVGYKDPAIYTLTLPFIDQLLVGSLPLMAPFTAYYLITETYNTNLFLAHPGATDPFVVTRKIRPFTAGGPNQSVSAILV